MPFQMPLDHIEGGETLDAFLDQFPGVTREMAIAALESAKESLLALSHEDPARRVCPTRSLQELPTASMPCRPSGWAFGGKKNGELLILAEQAGFDVLVTFDVAA